MVEELPNLLKGSASGCQSSWVMSPSSFAVVALAGLEDDILARVLLLLSLVPRYAISRLGLRNHRLQVSKRSIGESVIR